MQSETDRHRHIAGMAIYGALAKVVDDPSHYPAWDELDQAARERLLAAGDDMLLNLGLTALAEDVLGERTAVKAGIVEVEGKSYMRTPKGELRPISMVSAQNQLEDEMVRKVMFFARDLSDQIRRFKGHTFADLAAFQSLLEQQYGVTPKQDAKGNSTYSSYDDTLKVEVKIADLISFGPELQAAKKLVDECLKEWGADSHEALRALVNRVFSVEKEGQINRGELFSMLAMQIEDERWQRAMEAIRDSIRVIGTKAYLRFRFRDELGAWQTVTLNVASA